MFIQVMSLLFRCERYTLRVQVQIPVDWCVHSRISGAPILKYRCADSILNGALSFIMNNETRSLQIEKGAPNAKILNHHWRD